MTGQNWRVVVCNWSRWHFNALFMNFSVKKKKQKKKTNNDFRSKEFKNYLGNLVNAFCGETAHLILRAEYNVNNCIILGASKNTSFSGIY